ncbi:MAG: hypothetical protein N2645_15340 [Clostridia bacterium]|nr:hypothetical protein [Clostridia bacterium]
MKKPSTKTQTKIAILVVAIIVIGLGAVIISPYLGGSYSKTAVARPSIKPTEPKISIETPQPVLSVSQEGTLTPIPQATVSPEQSEQKNLHVKSIQEGQPKSAHKPSPPPKPVPKDTTTNKNIQPTYNKEDIEPQQSSPKTGDKNNNGQIYVEGFGWIKDEGSGGKGTIVNGMKENGNKIGIMD